MKISTFILILSLLVNFVHAQKLVTNTIEPETKQIIKETNWVKLVAKNNTKLQFKLKQVGDEVKLYYKINRRSDDGVGDNINYIRFLLDNNDSLKLNIPASIDVELAIRNTHYTPKLTDEPDEIPTYSFTREQLITLQTGSIKRCQIHFSGRMDDIQLKDKNYDLLSNLSRLLL